jgi:hypothetical protein
MFGTDLEKAYFDNSYVNETNKYDYGNINNTNNTNTANNVNTDIPFIPPTNKNTVVIPEVKQQENKAFDSILIQPTLNENERKIHELQQQLKTQTELNMKMNQDVHTIYDRFASKKKDVMKLLSFSFTILLAISLHFVISDLIKNYLINNDFSANKEQFIRISYPLLVFGLMWSLKVFNK